MKYIIEIIKQLFFIIYNLLIEIVKNSWEPLLTLLIKISILSGIIFGICTLVPHGIAILSGISYIGWVTILCVYHLITAKIEENFESEYKEVLAKNNEENLAQIDTDDVDDSVQEPITIKQVKDLISNPPETEKEKNDSESTRE